MSRERVADLSDVSNTTKSKGCRIKEGLRILLLEDSAEDVVLIEWELRRADMIFCTTVARDAAEFSDALLNFKPDVILADHSLPTFNSIEALELYKAHAQATQVFVPFILVTGHVSEDFAVKAFRAGVDDYILKDRLKRLPVSIESALEKYRISNERLRFYRELTAKQALMNDAQRLAQFGIWEADMRTGDQKWSDETFYIYGYEPGEIAPSYDRFLQHVHPDDLPIFSLTEKDVVENGLDYGEYEFRIVDKKGRLKYLYSRLQVYRDDAGVPVRLTGFNLDISKRKAAEVALQRREQEFRSLFDQNPDAVFSLDLHSRFTNVNTAFVEGVGIPREELIGRDFREILGRTKLESFYANFLAGLGNWSQRYEAEFTNKNGKVFTLDVTLMAVVVNDEIVGVHCLAKDITEKRRLEGLLNAAYRSAMIGGWEIDLSSSKVAWTAITRELHEVGPDFDPDVESAIAFYKEGDNRTAVRKAVYEGINSGIPWDLELQIVTASGKERWVRTIGQPEFKNGICTRLFGTIQDIDSRKTADETLKAAYTEKVSILESIGDAFFATDRNGIVTYWNNVAEVLLRTPRESIVGRNIWKAFPDAISSPFYDYLHKALHGRVSVHYQEFYAPRGMWFEGNVYPSATGISVYFKDVTKERRRLQAIEDQNNQLKDIAWIQSHKVRAPLARIMGLVSLLNDDNYGDMDLRHLLNLIETSAGELDDLIRKIVRKAEVVEAIELHDRI